MDKIFIVIAEWDNSQKVVGAFESVKDAEKFKAEKEEIEDYKMDRIAWCSVCSGYNEDCKLWIPSEVGDECCWYEKIFDERINYRIEEVKYEKRNEDS